MSRGEELAEVRSRQPIAELRRKADKARRRGIYTAEDIDLARATGREIARCFIWDDAPTQEPEG